MADTVYRVMLSLSTTGDLSASMGRIGAGAERAQSRVHALSRSSHEVGEAIESIGHRVGGFLEGVADKAIEVGKRIGEIGAVAGLALATYGVAKLNNELEQTSVSLAAIFQNQGFASNFTAATKLAGDEIARMKQDVKALPGDLGQLSAIMTTIATPAAQGGASADQIRQLAGRGMLVGKILGVQPEVVSRELANLLSGRAGAHNILGSRLGLIGDEAQRFNKEPATQRVSEIQAKFNTPAMNAAAEAFSHTWIANWTTLIDNVKYTFLAPITSPLFEHVKASVIEINSYFDTHKDQIAEIANLVSRRLVEGWEKIESIFKRVAPVIGHMAESLLRMQPAQLGDKLKHIAEAMLATKALGAGISGGASGLAFMSRLGGLGGMAGAIGPGLGLAAAPLVAIAASAAGAVDTLTNNTAYYHDEAETLSKSIKSNFAAAMTEASPIVDSVGDALRKFGDYLGVGFLQDVNGALIGIKGLFDKSNWSGVSLDNNPSGDFGQTVSFWRSLGVHVDSLLEGYDTQRSQSEIDDILKKFNDSKDVAGSVDRDQQILFAHALPKTLGDAMAEAQAKRGGGGGAGIHIHNMEINVEGNQDPSRVARLVMHEFQKAARNPKSSKFVPDYSASPHI